MELPDNISAVLLNWGNGHVPSAKQRQQLIDWERSQSWPRSPAHTIATEVDNRLALLQAVVKSDQPLPLPGKKTDRANWTDWIDWLWRCWLPLAQQLDRCQKASGLPFVQGILGGQGVGKTTLTQVMQRILTQLDQPTVILSIDDLYLSYAERQKLQQQDPRLIWRGPPGTHDIELGLRTLRQLKSAESNSQVSVPRFDKSLFEGQGDRTHPQICLAPAIILFEGWLVGTRPIADSHFTDEHIALPDPILTSADRHFARDSNQRLNQYLPLWQYLDSLIVIQPQNYRLSQQWRQQAERDSATQGNPGLSEREIENFVTYFWKALHPELFITPLTYSSTIDLVVNVKANHTLGELYVP